MKNRHSVRICFADFTPNFLPQSDVGNEYTRTLQTVGTLCGQIKQVLGTLPAGQQSTLQASLDGIQGTLAHLSKENWDRSFTFASWTEELSLISDVAESTVPGTTDVVAQKYVA